MSIKNAQTSIKNGRKKGDENRKATNQPTPRRGKQRDSRSGSKRRPPRKRPKPPKRAQTTTPRRREKENNHKQQKKPTLVLCASRNTYEKHRAPARAPRAGVDGGSAPDAA